MFRTRSVWIVLALAGIAGVTGVLAEEATSTQLARKFWLAFLEGDAATMGECYAPRVTLKSGSELLKSEYGLNLTSERRQDIDFDRAAIVKAYKVLFQRTGKAKWAERGKRLRDCQMTFITAADNNPLFEQFRCQHGDLLVQVRTEPNQLYFSIRQDPAGQWWVVAEAFD